jgi:hypothetical protein
MKLKAIHKDEALKPIPMIGKVGLEGGSWVGCEGKKDIWYS